MFVVAADHGHIATGGHGGWESVVTSVPAVFSGPGIPIVAGAASQSDVAPTVALLAGIPVPRFSAGAPLRSGRRRPHAPRACEAGRQRTAALGAYARTIAAAPPATPLREPVTADQRRAGTSAVRQDAGQTSSLRIARHGCATCSSLQSPACCCSGVMAIASWRALVAALAGTAGFYAVYNLLFFVVHGYTVVALGVQPRRAGRRVHQHASHRGGYRRYRGRRRGRCGVPAASCPTQAAEGAYLAGWLTLGPATLLVAMATLAVQAAMFVWQWGIVPTWRLPDLSGR